LIGNTSTKGTAIVVEAILVIDPLLRTGGKICYRITWRESRVEAITYGIGRTLGIISAGVPNQYSQAPVDNNTCSYQNCYIDTLLLYSCMQPYINLAESDLCFYNPWQTLAEGFILTSLILGLIIAACVVICLLCCICIAGCILCSRRKKHDYQALWEKKKNRRKEKIIIQLPSRFFLSPPPFLLPTGFSFQFQKSL